MTDVAESSTSELAYGRTEWDDYHHLPTNTGLTNEKITMWSFLGSDCLLFGSLISTYLLLRNRVGPATSGPTAADLFDIPFTSVSSFVLLMSSLTMVLAVILMKSIRGKETAMKSAMRKDNKKRRCGCRRWR